MKINLEILDENLAGRSVKNAEARLLLNVLSDMKQLPPMPYQGIGISNLITQLRSVSTAYGLCLPLNYSNFEIGNAIRTIIKESITKGEFTMDDFLAKVYQTFQTLPLAIQGSIQVRRSIQ